jgi:hypothetical protein
MNWGEKKKDKKNKRKKEKVHVAVLYYQTNQRIQFPVKVLSGVDYSWLPPLFIAQSVWNVSITSSNNGRELVNNRRRKDHRYQVESTWQ